MPHLASHVSSVPASGIRRLFLLASELDGVISLVVGEPDVAVAPHIAAAAIEAWQRDDTNYTANGGIPPLRAAIVEKLARENAMVVETEQVWVTVGATQGLHQALHLLLAAGDEVLVPDPGYTTFSMTPAMLAATVVPYALHADAQFMPNLAELELLVTPKTRAIIVNSPSNPLGTVFPEAVLRELLDFARRHDLWVISDEVYEFFTWGEPHVSMASLDTDDRVFSVFSLSKTYALTGVRVGYLVTPKGMAETMRSVQEAAISCVATPDQYAGVAAIEGSQAAVSDAREHYRVNLAAATALLDERGIRYLEPHGTFYLWIDVSHASDGDVARWAERFLLEKRVAVAPGSAFGRSGEGWIRVCIAHPLDQLLEGLGRLPAPALHLP
jgi:aspartate/methionine/tyrosine aminotransferase